jgi:hypothetical protein
VGTPQLWLREGGCLHYRCPVVDWNSPDPARLLATTQVPHRPDSYWLFVLALGGLRSYIRFFEDTDSALTMIATLLGAGQLHVFAESIQQRGTRVERKRL